MTPRTCLAVAAAPLLAGFLTMAPLLTGATTPSYAQNADVNNIIGGGDSATEQNTPAANAPTPAPATTPSEGDDAAAESKAWVKHKSAINHVQVLAGRPLPSETCRNVIFDARPSLNKRHDVASGKTIALTMKNLCLVGFRNDSEERTLVVRLGEAFSTLAIVLDPKLFTGYPIAPGQQITVPLRQLPVPSLDVSLEVAWEEDLEKPDPKIASATLSLSRAATVSGGAN
ncbi:MAG: hypothetical protein AAGJ70_08525 [Pseudomonadota bacterium]